MLPFLIIPSNSWILTTLIKYLVSLVLCPTY